MAKKNKMPRAVRVGHTRVEIGVVNPEFIPDLYGVYLPDIQRVLVNKSLQEDHLREIVIHELLHAAVANYKLPFPSDDAEEDVVNRLAPAILELIRDNPSLISWITGK